MGNRTENQTAKLLFSRQNRKKHMALLISLAMLMTAGIGAIFHLNAIAKTYQETVLTCTAEPQSGPGYAGFFVHTHNSDCFDADQNLVCGLPEIEAHTHDASCYTTQSVLICTLPESDGHQHTEECYTAVQGELICGESTEPTYDEDGNVIEEGHVHTDECFAWTSELSCGMAEGEGAHHHDDACFETVTTLTCDKPEIIQHTHTDDCWQKDENGALTLICELPEVTEHVHGPECFTVYELDDGEPEETVAPEETETEKTAAEETAGVSMPEQSFHGATDDIEVDVIAPEGAFPEGTTMTVTAVTDDETLSTLADAVDGKVMNVQAVDIVFKNAAGEQIEPLVPIRVNMKAAIISEGDDVALVHLPETQTPEAVAEAEETPNPNPETPAAQIVEAERIPAEADPTATEDAISFESDAFSIYGLVSVSIEKIVLASNGINYKITMTCGDEIGIPKNAELTVEEILPEPADDGETSAYDEYLTKTAEALGWETAAAQYARFFDITIVGEDGGKLQPAEGSTVSVKIELADTESSSLNVVHFGEENTEVMEFSQETVHEGCELSFEAGSFSVYAIVDAPEPATTEVRTVTDLSELADGTAFYLACAGTSSYVTNTVRTTDGVLIETKDSSSASDWFFEPVEGNTNQFRIYTYEDNNTSIKKYIYNKNMDWNKVGLTDQKSDALVFELSTAGNNQFYLKSKTTQTVYLQHSNGGNGIRLHSDKNNNGKFSITYAESYTLDKDPYGLDGQTFGIAYNDNSTVAAAVNGEGNTAQDKLTAQKMVIRQNVVANNGVLLVANNSEITEWTFEAVEEDRYRLSTTVNGEKKYLAINGETVTLTDSPDGENTLITAIPGTGENSGKWHFSVKGYSLNLSGETFNAASGSNPTTWLNLVEKSSLSDDDFVNYTARKISANDEVLSATEKDANGEIQLDEEGHVVYKKDKAQVVLYTRVWNDTTKKYEYYAVDHDGSLIRVYESGDQINWIGNQVNSALWEFTEYTNDDGTPNYYYELENTAYKGTYLAPQTTGIVSDHTVGINLNGRREGYDYSSVIAWDDTAYAYSGLKIEQDENGVLRAVACPLEEAGDFHFAVITPSVEEADPVTTVETVDNDLYGISIKMVDFNNKVQGDRDTVQNGFFGARPYQQYKPDQGLLSTNLTGGYPTTTALTNNAGHSLNELFREMTAANHLFIQSVYNESGYFEYDSTQNFAHLNGNGNFTVYNQLGAIGTSTGNTRAHGQFMPYNDISSETGYAKDSSGNVITNLYNVKGQELPDSDPRKYEKLYSIPQNAADYFFGMEVSAAFTQTPNGEDNWGHDIIFEFTGDDDFWLYVDGELVLDLGGIHSALAGSVNFRTGEVTYDSGQGNQTTTTLIDIFRANYEARGLNETQIEEKLNALFTEKEMNGETVHVFTDYSRHEMKMFYMERGAGASNLKMRFNLASVQPGTMELSKKLTGAESESNKLIQYPYQIWYREPEYGEDGNPRLDEDGNPMYGEPVQMIQAETSSGNPRVVYKGTKKLVPFRETLVAGGFEYNNVFLLKPGETAVAVFPDNNCQYEIIECGVDTEVYDKVSVNGEENELSGKPYGNTAQPTDGAESTYYGSTRTDFGIDFDTLGNRPRVEYNNHVTPDVMRTVSVKKAVYDTDGHLLTDDQAAQIEERFTFRLYLGNEFSNENDLAPANMYRYHIKGPDGNYNKWDVASQKFVSLGVDTFEEFCELSKEDQRAGTFTTSMNGSISKIPAGYTVEVRDLIVGTKYKVEERDAEIPKGYTRKASDGYVRTDTDPDYVYYTEAGTYGKHELTQGSTTTAEPISDAIASKTESPMIEIRNQEGWGLTAKKTWTDKDFVTHDDIYLAVYLKNTDGTPGTLVNGTVRRLKNSETEIYWFFPDLHDQTDYTITHTFDEYVVREVALTGNYTVDPETNAVTGYTSISPLSGSIEIGCTPVGREHLNETYTVSYETGESTGRNTNIRSDTITNSRPGIMFYKTKWNPTESLEGAKFTLKDKHTGNDASLKSTLTSDAAGLITTAYLSQGTYTLTEVATPKGYEGLPGPITITVEADDTLTFQLGEDTEHTVTMSAEGNVAGTNDFFTVEKASSSDMRAIVKIKNRRSELRVLKQDAETNEKLPGVHFALYEQVIGQDGQPRKNYSPMTGYEDLVTNEDGLLPKVTMDLPAGTYYLEETQTLEGYRPLDEDIIFTVGQDGTFTVNSSKHKNWLTSEDHEGTTSYTLTIPNGNRKDMTFHKVWYPIGTSTEKQQWKQDITVTLYRTDGESGTAIAEYTIGMDHGTLTAASTPKVSGEDAPAIEVNTPTEYDYSFTIKDLPYGDTFYITENEMEMNLIGYGENKNGTITVIPGAKQATDETNCIINRDTGGYELPSTGGRGTRLFTAIGAMLTMTAGAILTIRRKRTCSG